MNTIPTETPTMTKGAKVALRHAANAIDGTRPAGGVKLGASGYVSLFALADRHDRPFASVYLARRAGFTPESQTQAHKQVSQRYGLTGAQVIKLDAVAASTHNLVQRSQRVASFLRKVTEKPGYVGLVKKSTGVVAASL